MHMLLLETIALVGGTVHTLEPGADPIVGATVLIEDDRITAVGVDLEVPEGAEVVQIDGLHVIPGLIDGVAAFDPDHDALYLDAGVTLVHDSGSPTGQILGEKSPEMRDRHPGPSLLATSPVFAGMETQRPGAIVLLEPERAAAQVDGVMEILSGNPVPIDSFTVERTLTPKQHAVAAGIGRESGLKVVGSLPYGMTPAEAAANGHSIVVGLDSFFPAGTRFETLGEDLDADALAAEVAEAGLAVAPMLVGTSRILVGAASEEEPEILRALGPRYDPAWQADLEFFRMLRESESLDLARRSLRTQREITAALHAAGVPLVAGSGAASALIGPGEGLVDELVQWGEAGLSPLEVLRAATAGTAAALGVGDRHGTIAPGRVANLAVLGSDPTRTLEALRRPEIVVVRGQVRERFDLDDARAELVARFEAARAARRAPVALAPPPLEGAEVLCDGRIELISYGDRTAVERYAAGRRPDGEMIYGARIRVMPAGDRSALEMVVVQRMRGGLVDSFEITLDVLDEDGAPVLGEGDSHAFHATGAVVPETKGMAVERRRYGKSRGTLRTAEPIAVVGGSSALTGLITAVHGRIGTGYSLTFEGQAMEPLVDRFRLAFEAEDHRMTMADSSGVSLYGFEQGGRILFGARAEGAGRLDFRALEPDEGAPAALELPESRVFVGAVGEAVEAASGADGASDGEGGGR